MTDREAMKLALEALDEGLTMKEWRELVAALRDRLAQPEQVSVPEGWKLVPIEPTDAMLSVPVNIDLRECVTPGGVTGLDAVGLFNAWEAMIEAAPQPWETTDMAYRPGGLSMEQDGIVTRYYPSQAGDYMGHEPVAWLDKEMEMAYTVNELPDVSGTSFIPLYTAPPKREWVGLTDEEEIELDEKYGDDFNAYIDARDTKLKEKNT